MTASGFTTSLMPHSSAEEFQIDFDFLRHRLDIATVSAAVSSLDLGGATGRRLLRRFSAMLDDLGVGTTIWPMPDRTEHTTMAESYAIDGAPLAPSHP